MIIKNGEVFQEDGSFRLQDLYVENHRIVASEDEVTDKTIVDAAGLRVIPGLVDIHSHGAFGHDFSDADPEGLKIILKYEKSHGITSYCPTSMTLPAEELKEIFATIKTVGEMKAGATVRGINMEGPFISPAKKGAQAAENIMPCDYDTAAEAMRRGAHHVTHLYNAMQPLAHREPGLIGAACDDGQCMAEMICDGIHIHPAVIRATFKMFGPERIVLISDSMMATGMENGTYQLGGQEVTMKDCKATLKDGTIAGSATNLYDCMRKAVSFGVPLEEAIFAATRNPAKSIGIYDEVGSLSVGKKADILLVTDDLELREVL